jgi:peptide/nickel transport system permease protein
MRLGYVLRRLGFLVMVMWAAATINFMLPRMTGIDPIRMQINLQITMEGLTEETAQARWESYTKLFGLDKPVWEQYLIYMKNMSRLSLGYSIKDYPRTVIEIIAQVLPWTLALVGTATVIAFIIGTVLGALLGWNNAPRAMSVLIPPLMVFSAAPAFVIAMVLIYVVSYKLHWTPLMGGFSQTNIPDWSSFSFWVDVIWHAILPACSLIVVSVGSWALGMRAMMITVEGADYMTFAEAKGLKGSRVFFRYALRNAMLPQVTSLAMRMGAIVTGSTVVEVFFGYPGVGSKLNQALGNFDYYLIYGIVFMLVGGIALATFLVDMIYPLLDPRISY